MSKILYISLTGMTEALGESQVVQYLEELAKNNTICLLSFEKPTEAIYHERMAKRLANAKIKWKFFQYSNRFGILSTLWQIIVANFVLAQWIRQEKIEIVHTRSLVPGVMGMLLKKIFNIKFLFDIRGFALDEKIMDGRLKKDAWLTKILRKIEKRVYQAADHIVTLTHASKPIIENNYSVANHAITVIPTCTDMQLFKPVNLAEKQILKAEFGFSADDIIFMHNGSLNGWVDFEAELKLFSAIAFLEKNAKFLFLNRDQHADIYLQLKKFNIPLARCQIKSAAFSEVYRYLNCADICVFFIKPSFAKKASAPTKFAELVATHLLSVTNSQYGDMEYYLNAYQVGLLFDLQEVHQTPENAAKKVLEFMQKKSSSDNNDFNQLFSTHFSRQIAVERYQQIYEGLKSGNSISTQYLPK